MFQDTQPAPLGDLGAGMDEFRVGSSREVAALLRRLLEGGITVILSAPNGAHLRSMLWTVDVTRDRLAFNADAHDPQVQAIVDAGEAVAVAYLDSIKVQFDVGSPMLVHGAAASVLQASLPREMFRFQRRQSFRVRPARGAAVVARLRHPALPDMALTLRVLDISIGGCALFLPPNVPPLPAGGRVHGVQVELDAGTRLHAALEVHHVTSLGVEDGLRLGCSLHGLDAQAQRTLQRYIDLTQKRSRMLVAG